MIYVHQGSRGIHAHKIKEGRGLRFAPMYTGPGYHRFIWVCSTVGDRRQHHGSIDEAGPSDDATFQCSQLNGVHVRILRARSEYHSHMITHFNCDDSLIISTMQTLASNVRKPLIHKTSCLDAHEGVRRDAKHAAFICSKDKSDQRQRSGGPLCMGDLSLHCVNQDPRTHLTDPSSENWRLV